MAPASNAVARDLTLVLSHADDGGAEHVLAGVEVAVSDGLARPFLRVVVGRDDTDPDPVRWKGDAVGPDGAQPVERILDRIARAREASTIQLVGLLTMPADHRAAARLDRALEGMRMALDRVLGYGMVAVPARIAVLGYGDPMVHEQFFSSPHARNLAIIPLDRSDDRSAARPIERSDAAAFRGHGSIEFMTVCGLWSSVARGPLSEIPLTPAVGGAPQVQLVQSSVRFLRTPPIPARELVDVSRELPLPELFMPANDPSRRVGDLFAEVRAEELDYRVEDAPELKRFTMSPGSFFRMIGRNTIGVLRELPGIVASTVRGEVAELSQGIAQRAVGEDSRILVQLNQVVARAADSKDGSDADAFADGIDALVRRSELQFVDPVPGDIWTQLSGRIMGVLDGDPEVSPQRAAALGDAALLVTDRSVVTGGVPWDRAWAPGDRSVVGDAHGTGLRFDPPEELLSPEVKADTDWVSDLLDLNAPLLAAEDSPSDAEAEAFGEDDAEDEWIDPVEDDDPVDQALIRLREQTPPEVIDAPHHGLLLRVLTDLRRQRRAATLDVQRLVETAVRTTDDRPLRVRPWVPTLAAIGLALVLLAAGTTDPANRFATSTGWILWAREAVFILATVALATSALALSTLLDRLPEGTKNVLLLTGGSVSALALILFRDQIRAEFSQQALQNNTVAVFAGLLVAAGVAAVLFQAQRSEDLVQRGGARVLGAFALLYGFFALLAVQALDGSLIRDLEETTRTQVRILLVFGGLVLFLTSLTNLVVRRFAAARRLDRSLHERTWAAEQLVTALEARTRLQSAEWQWIGTATVLARLITYPFGRAEQRAVGPMADVGDPEVLKGSRATLSLTNAGREAIDVKLRSILVNPSWLRQQYEILVMAYREVLARRTGSTVSDLQERRPEQDSYAPMMDTFDDGLLRGDRWEFARRVAVGEFDRLLAQAADSLDLEEVYGPLLAESGAMVLEEDGSGNDTVRDFMHRILPVDTPQLPAGLTDVLFSGGDPRRGLESWVWWPEGLLGELTGGSWKVAPTRFVRERTGGALVVAAVRLDLSVPFRHDACFVPPSGGSVELASVVHTDDRA
jgi:hypothetical protein